MIYLDANRASVGAYAFKGCTGITDINLYYFTGSIGEETFSGCTGVTSLYVPNIASFGEKAFLGCTGIENLEVHYPELTTQFQDCSALLNIVLGEEVTKVGAESFNVTNAGAAINPPRIISNCSIIYTYYFSKDYSTDRPMFYEMLNYITNWKEEEKRYAAQLISSDRSYKLSSLATSSERNWFFLNANTEIENKYSITPTNTKYISTSSSNKYLLFTTLKIASPFLPLMEAQAFDQGTTSIVYDFGAYSLYNLYMQAKYEAIIARSPCQFYNYKNGMIKNSIYVYTGENTDNTLKIINKIPPGNLYTANTYDERQYFYPEHIIAANSEQKWSDIIAGSVSTYDIRDITVPSYAPVEELSGGITANYASKLAYANSKLDLSKVNVNLLYNVPNKQDVLKANQPGIYILPEAEAEAMEVSTDTMQNFFYEDGMKQLTGVNDITLNPLPEGEESSITNLKVYYFNRKFKNVGDASGDYDYDSEGVLKKTTQLGLQEGRYDADGNYVGLGGCYDYNEATGEYTYNVFGSYVPEIATTTFSVEAFQAEVSGIYAELDTAYIESLLMEGYDSDKEAFNLGTTITREMFKVYESCQDGTVTPNRIPADDYSISPNTVSGVGLNDITIKQISTGYETIAYVKGFSKAADSAMEDLGVAPGDYEGLAEKITDIKDQIAEKTEQLNQYEDTMNAIQSSLGTTEDISTEEGLTAVEQKVAAVMTEITTLETKLTAVEEALASFGTVPGTGEGGTITAEDITGMITEVKAELDASKAKADSLSKFGEDIRSKLSLSSSATDTEVMNKINELLEEVKNGTASNSELATQLNTLKNQIYSLQNEKELLNNQNANYKNQVSTLTAAKESAENAKVELEKKVLKLENENTSLRSEAKESEVEKTAVESKLAVAETENVSLQAENTSLKSQLATVKKEVAETSSQISSYQQEAKNSAQKTELLLQNKENLEKQVAELQDKVDSSIPEQSKTEETEEPAEENLTDIQYAEAGNNQPSLEVSEEITGGTILVPEEAITSTESEMDMGILGKALALGTTIIGGSGGTGVLLFKRKKRY